MDISSAVDRLFAEWSGPATPGAVVAATRDGRTLHEAAYGMADLAHAIPLDRRSVLRIGSQTKQFTVLLTLLLEAEGKLSLDDEVHRYAPWLPRYPDPVTLRQLAGNTGGLRDFLEIMIWSGLDLAAPSSRRTARDLLARHDEVNFRPDEQMLYSNSGFFLLSEIVEEVSGRSYNELLQERITGPLGMEDTSLLVRDGDILPRLADQHARGAGGWRTVQWGFPLGGEGGMASSLRDMLVWQANIADPMPSLAPALARMEAPRHYLNGTETRYRLGLVGGRYRGLRTIGHGGTTAGAKSESMRFPDQNFGIVILGNAAELSPFTLARRIADRALASEMMPMLPDTRQKLAGAAGLYRHDGGDDIFEITPDGNFASSGGTVSITQVAEGVFAPERSIMHLSFSLSNDAIDATWCGTPRHYRRLPVPMPGGDVTGDYVNPALGLDARIGKAAATLTLQIRSDVGVLHATLSWIDSDLLTVHREPGGPWLATLLVTEDGLSLSSDRTKGLRLRRI
jgi:CubicO group peptidase (beta-lactamase class C family)